MKNLDEIGRARKITALIGVVLLAVSLSIVFINSPGVEAADSDSISWNVSSQTNWKNSEQTGIYTRPYYGSLHILDIFAEENGDISEYSGDTDRFRIVDDSTSSGFKRTVTDPVRVGDYAIHGWHNDRSGTTETYTLTRSLDYSMSPDSISFYILFTGGNNKWSTVTFRNSGTYVFEVGFNDNSEISWNYNKTENVLTSANTDQWYKVEIKNLDWSNYTADVYIDGTKDGSNLSFENNAGVCKQCFDKRNSLGDFMPEKVSEK